MVKSSPTLLLSLVPLLASGLGTALGYEINGLQCYVAGECLDSQILEISTAGDARECLHKCQDVVGCEWFTYYDTLESCVSMTGCIRLNATSCADCVSGEEECPEYNCQEKGKCLGALEGLSVSQTKETCHAACVDHPRCFWSSFDTDSKLCLLTNDCPAMDRGCETCMAAEKGCLPGQVSGDIPQYQAQATPEWSEWTNWSECETACCKGLGSRSRTRTCSVADKCPANDPSEQTEKCGQAEACPGWALLPGVNTATPGPCVQFVDAMKNHEGAKAKCNEIGGTGLATIHTEEQNKILGNLAAGKLAWIGLNDFDKEGTFVWSDGSPTDFKAWADNEPNNANGENGGQQCATTNYKVLGQWDDATCSGEATILCQKLE